MPEVADRLYPTLAARPDGAEMSGVSASPASLPPAAAKSCGEEHSAGRLWRACKGSRHQLNCRRPKRLRQNLSLRSHHLVDRTCHEGRRDRLALPALGRIMNQCVLVAGILASGVPP